MNAIPLALLIIGSYVVARVLVRLSVVRRTLNGTTTENYPELASIAVAVAIFFVGSVIYEISLRVL